MPSPDRDSQAATASTTDSSERPARVRRQTTLSATLRGVSSACPFQVFTRGQRVSQVKRGDDDQALADDVRSRGGFTSASRDRALIRTGCSARRGLWISDQGRRTPPQRYRHRRHGRASTAAAWARCRPWTVRTARLPPRSIGGETRDPGRALISRRDWARSRAVSAGPRDEIDHRTGCVHCTGLRRSCCAPSISCRPLWRLYGLNHWPAPSSSASGWRPSAHCSTADLFIASVTDSPGAPVRVQLAQSESLRSLARLRSSARPRDRSRPCRRPCTCRRASAPARSR